MNWPVAPSAELLRHMIERNKAALTRLGRRPNDQRDGESWEAARRRLNVEITEFSAALRKMEGNTP